jgi:hypothetical protein
MNRLIVIAVLTMILGFAAGYGVAQRKNMLMLDRSNLTFSLHHELDIAHVTGNELGYLENAKSDKASLYARLTFCGSVERANNFITQGAMPFPISIESRGLKQGREIMGRYQDSKCVASVDKLLEVIPKLQSQYK